jgi:general secretion pathway protein C
MSQRHGFEEKPNWKAKITERLRALFSFRKGKRSAAGLGEDHFPAKPERTGTLTNTLRAIKEKTRAFTRPKNSSNDAPMFSGGAIAIATPRFQWNQRTLRFICLVLAVLIITFLLADLVAYTIEKFIPEPPISSLRSSRKSLSPSGKTRTLTDYQIIITRNLFNNRGLIPGDQLPGGPGDQNNVPVKTGLPFNLIGTLVLRNELRSIATIEDKNENTVYPVRIDDEIPGRVKILSIEPSRVIFINKSSGRREFVDLPELGTGAAISLGTTGGGKGKGGQSGIEQLAPNQFNVSRTEVDKALSDLNKILTEARAIPHIENGVPGGFKLIQIVPNSIYDKLGLKDNDILCGVDGDPINDPGKAFELLASLKTRSALELCVKRGGKMNNFSYLIR